MVKYLADLKIARNVFHYCRRKRGGGEEVGCREGGGGR
jgi:hypothetical protein